MTESGFNIKPGIELEDSGDIPLDIPSGRFRFFKARRYGLLHFVKRPSPEYADDLLTLEALHKEFIIGYSLSHPAIVRYTALEDHSLWEEFIDGKTLQELIDGNDPRLSDPSFTASVARQLFEALSYIHNNGVLHLDIKPENLMITSIGDSLKLIDFGCARSAVCDSTPGFTEEYSAPEQKDSATNCFTDIFLAGQVIRQLASLSGSARKWRRFVEKAMADSPSDRFSSAEEALKHLPATSSPKRLNAALITASFCILAAAVIFAVLALPRRDAAPEAPETATVPETVSPDTMPPAVAETIRALEEPLPAAEVPVEEAVTSSPAILAPQPETTAPAPKGQDSEVLLSRQISDHITDYYAKNIFPILDNAASTETDMNSPEFALKLREALSRARTEALSFGKELTDRYPAKKDFIESGITEKLVEMNEKVNHSIP